MNLKLRRTLSSFLAFVMLCSCMVVANVGNVFAATNEYSFTVQDAKDNLDANFVDKTDVSGTYKNYFTLSNAVIRANASGNPIEFKDGLTFTTTGTSSDVEMVLASTGKNNATLFKLTNSAGEPVTLSVSNPASTTNDPVTSTSVTPDENGFCTVVTTAQQTFTASELPADTYKLVSSSTRAVRLFSVKVTETSNDSGEDPDVPPTTTTTYKWYASDRNAEAVDAIFGGSQSFGTSTSSHSSAFVDQIFTTTDGTTGAIDGQQFIKLSELTFTPKSTGEVKFYITSNAGDKTSEVTVSDSTGSIVTYTAQPRNGKTDIQAMTLDLKEGTTYTLSATSQIQLFAAIMDGTVADTTYNVTATISGGIAAEKVTGATVIYSSVSGKTYTATELNGVYTAKVDYGDSLSGVTITADGYYEYDGIFDTAVSSATSFTFTLSPIMTNVTVSGTVTDAEGVAVAAADVSITLSTGLTTSTRTDAEGKYSFSFDVLPSQVNTLTADFVIEKLTYETITASGIAVNENVTKDFILTKQTGSGSEVDLFVLSGKVVDSNSNPIANATVATATGLSTVTGPDGTFTIKNIDVATALTVEAMGYLRKTTENTYDQTTSDIVITLDVDTNVSVKFTITGGTADAGITITRVSNNSTQAITNGSASFDNSKPGEVFHISGKPGNVAQWENVNGTLAFHNGGSADERYFVYTVPVNATAANNYGVTFTVNDNVATALDTTDIGKGTYPGAIGYGDYGFGTDKANKGGTEARDVVSYQFAQPTMKDYSSGFADTAYNTIDKAGSPGVANQYGILDSGVEGTQISFTVADVNNEAGGKVYAYVDKSGKSLTITDDTNATVTQEAVGSRIRFAVESGKTYTIKASGGRTYLKSIRIYNPNNIFKVLSADTIGTVSDIIKGNTPLATKLNLTEDSTDTIIRIVGQVVLSGADASSIAAAESALSDIDVLGITVFDKAAYDSVVTTTGVYYYPGASVSDTYAVPDELADIQITDMVNTGIEALGNAPAYGSENSTDTKDLYCQTFVRVNAAAHNGLVFIPYCVIDGSTIYTIAQTTSQSPNVTWASAN